MAYIFSISNPRPTALPAENFSFLLLVEVINFLQSQGYVTRGSSTYTMGFSATPDGVDRWSGQVYSDVVSSNADHVWHALESPIGHQICFEIWGTGGLTRSNIVFSVNKLEDAGAWRNVVSAIDRPQDITSIPDFGREITAGEWRNAGVGTGFYHIVLGDDFKNLTVMDILDTDSGGSGALLAINELTSPVVGDENHFVIMSSASATSGFVAASYIPPSPLAASPSNLVGRTNASITNFGLTTLTAGLTFPFDIMDAITGPDIFSGKEVEMPLGLWTDDSTKYFRSSIRDIRRVRQTGLTYGTTFDGLQRIVFGNLSFPWDGLTSLGQPDFQSQAYELNGSAAANSGVDVGISGRFNLGMEKI